MIKCTSKSCLNNQFIWYNKQIKVRGETLYCERLLQCGMWNINDLYIKGQLMPFETWRIRGAMPHDYLLWRSILMAIPKQWKVLLRTDGDVDNEIKQCGIICDKEYYKTGEPTAKNIKHCLIANELNKLKDRDFKAKEKYKVKFPTVTREIWQNACLSPHILLHDNKIIEMQYKILNRIIGNNKLLYKMGKKPSPNCERCQMYIEDIEHIFFNCEIVKQFWYELSKKWNVFDGSYIPVTAQDIILGISLDNLNSCDACNIIVLYGKKYLYNCKMIMQVPTVVSFLNYLQVTIDIIMDSEMMLI